MGMFDGIGKTGLLAVNPNLFIFSQYPSEFRRLNLEFTTTGKSSSSRSIQINGKNTFIKYGLK